MNRLSTASIKGFTSRLNVRKEGDDAVVWNDSTSFSCRLERRNFSPHRMYCLVSPVRTGSSWRGGELVRTIRDGLRLAHEHHYRFVKGVSP